VSGEGSGGVDQLRPLLESIGGLANVDLFAKIVTAACGLRGLQGKSSNSSSYSVLLIKLKVG
jgi:hypothetical protein